jgi:hypothetical protein
MVDRRPGSDRGHLRYLAEGSLDEGVVYDAHRARLIEIGETVKHLDPALTDQEPDIPWRAIERLIGSADGPEGEAG